MAVTILVTFDELPEGQQTARYTEQQNASLLALEEAYRTDVVEKLSHDERDKYAQVSRHFWYNGEFQPHRDRTISHIATTATVALNFRRDSYIVSTPRYANTDRYIDPERTVAEVVEFLHSMNLIGSACCYEVLNAKGDVLKPDKSLSEQNALPYTDPRKKQESHLLVRMRKHIVRGAVIMMSLCAIVGGSLGWLIHHIRVQ